MRRCNLPPASYASDNIRSSSTLRLVTSPNQPSRTEDTTLAIHRERAERLLNLVRLGFLGLLGVAAVVYAPHISPSVRRVNWLVLVPLLAWSLAQVVLGRRVRRLPEWLSIANPVVDITAVTTILLGYGLVESPSLALKAPIVLAYFAILAARPIASSARRAAAVATLMVLEYGSVVAFFVVSGRVTLTDNPVAASVGQDLAILDEGTKLVLLIVAGVISTYATAWHERLADTYYREAQYREQLQVALGKARMQSLKLQLAPHFLFNTLNGISALISTDTLAAERMLVGLSDFLRLSLELAGSEEVPLDREIRLLERYLAIQELRGQSLLRIVVDVAAGTSRALVPSLILQPLAENAIKHGFSERAGRGSLEIHTSRVHDSLVLKICDDGVGETLVAGKVPRMGVGIGNARARLQQLYGDAHTFDVESAPGRGFAVTIMLPFHTVAAKA